MPGTSPDIPEAEASPLPEVMALPEAHAYLRELLRHVEGSDDPMIDKRKYPRLGEAIRAACATGR